MDKTKFTDSYGAEAVLAVFLGFESCEPSCFFSAKVIKRVSESYNRAVPQFSHLTSFKGPPLGTVNIVPKKEIFSVPQFGHVPFKIRKSFRMALVISRAIKYVAGRTINQLPLLL